jgi:hypothetical protein
MGDVLGGRIGLLRRQATLLDREGRPVAGGIDTIQALDAGVVIDRDEAALVGGRPSIAGPPSPAARSPPQAQGRDRRGQLDAPPPSPDTLELANTSIPRALSSSLTAASALAPNTARGADSGVITAMLASTPRSTHRRWVIRAIS